MKNSALNRQSGAQIETMPLQTNGKSNFLLLTHTLEILVIFFIFGLVNTNAFNRFRQFPEVDTYSDNEGWYILVAAITIVVIGFLLRKNQLLEEYFAKWKNNKALIAFVGYAVLSILWTVYLPATLYKLVFLLFSTIAGSYLAVRYRIRGMLDVLAWVGGIWVILSILLVIGLPPVGVMHNDRFAGSWIGIFWHRNHTGNIFSFFSMMFLLRTLLDKEAVQGRRVVFALLYLLSTAMVFGSRSAAGIIIFVALHFACGLIVIWLKFYERIKPWHYYVAAAVLLAGFLVFVTNTEFFFGLLGRSATLTGRTPIWEDLFRNFYPQKPIFGYGYGALWMQKSFRVLMQIRHHWSHDVYFADNGFFDILLNTGLVGLLLFAATYIPFGIRSLKQAVNFKSWIYFFPFLTFLYVFVGNLAYSFMLEVDQLVWMLLVIMVFLTTLPKSKSMPQP